MHVNWVSQRNGMYLIISIRRAEIRTWDLQNTEQCPWLQLTWQTDLCRFPNVAVRWCTATSNSEARVFTSKLWHRLYSLKFLVAFPSPSGQIPGYYLKLCHDRFPSTYPIQLIIHSPAILPFEAVWCELPHGRYNMRRLALSSSACVPPVALSKRS
jgi:hypothetical protein